MLEKVGRYRSTRKIIVKKNYLSACNELGTRWPRRVAIRRAMNELRKRWINYNTYNYLMLSFGFQCTLPAALLSLQQSSSWQDRQLLLIALSLLIFPPFLSYLSLRLISQPAFQKGTFGQVRPTEVTPLTPSQENGRCGRGIRR